MLSIRHLFSVFFQLRSFGQRPLEDSGFPTTTALGQLGARLGRVQWLRCAQLRGHGSLRLFGTNSQATHSKDGKNAREYRECL